MNAHERRKVLAGCLLTCGIMGCVFGILFLSQPSQNQPTCNGQVMQPSDTCVVFVNGVYNHTDTYEDRVRANGLPGTLGGLFLIGGLVLFVVGIPLAVRAFREAQAPDQRGATLLASKRYEEALAAFDQALKLAPTNAHYHNERGFALYNLKRYEEALAAFDQAIKFAPTIALYHHNRGDALRELKRYEEAVAAYDQAIKLAPTEAAYRRNREAALREANRAESQSPDQRGDTLFAAKRYKEALVSQQATTEAVLGVLRGYHSKKTFYLAPNIPDHKLTNASSRCNIPSDEQVLALIDCTIFGSAKDCILFGTKGLYYRHPGAKPKRGMIPWSDFPSCNFVQHGIWKIGVVGKDMQMSSTGSQFRANELCPMLESLRFILTE